MTGSTAAFCDEDRLSQLMARLSTDESEGIRELDMLLASYPDDPRLHFLQGSFLAAGSEYARAASAMRRAVDLEPDYHLARFQLGFLLLTSGQPYAAQEAWGPLHGLPRNHYLRLFVEGLCHLIRDEFSDAIALLREGMDLNQDNAPMNADMQLVITGIENRSETGSEEGEGSGEPVSAAQMLLQQAALKATHH